MKKMMLILMALILTANFLYAGEVNPDTEGTAPVTTESIKIAKLKLTSGKNITGRKVVIGDSKVNFRAGSPVKDRSVDLAEVEGIYRPTKNGAAVGFLFGTLAGGAAMLAFENNYEQPETKTKEWRTYEPWGYIDHSVEVTETKEMAIGPKIAIVAGGALLGTLIGMTFKTGWEKIYPETSDKLSMQIHQKSDLTMLQMEYKF